MIRAVIIDDIDVIREENIAVIKEHCPHVSILAEANSVAKGVEIINQYMPDLVFLDVEMPDGTGFDLLKQFPKINFKVIFISGHNTFAVNAFRYSAIDYLLKPINSTSLIEAVEKVEQAIDSENINLKFSTLFSNIEQPKKAQKIILKTTEKIFTVNIYDVVRCEGELNYTTFYFLDGSKVLVSKNLKEYDAMLADTGFFRSHQSHLINTAHIDYYKKAEGGGLIIMKNKASVPLSVRKKNDFLILLENLQ